MTITITFSDGLIMTFAEESARELLEKLESFGDNCSQRCKEMRKDLQNFFNTQDAGQSSVHPVVENEGGES